MTFSPMDLIEINSTSAYDSPAPFSCDRFHRLSRRVSGVIEPRTFPRVLNKGLKIALLRPTIRRRPHLRVSLRRHNTNKCSTPLAIAPSRSCGTDEATSSEPSTATTILLTPFTCTLDREPFT